MSLKLSPEQHRQFETDGFLRLPGALPPERVELLLDAAERLRRADTVEREGAQEQAPDWRSRFHNPVTRLQEACDRSRWEARNVVVRDTAFLDLIDHPETFYPVVDLLGDNIFLMGSHLMVRERTPMSVEELSRFPLDWHRDLGTSALELSEPQPRLSIRIAYWLTELSGPGQGAMRVVPGSHRLLGEVAMDPATDQPYGAIEVLAQPGDALLFEQRLWHAAAPNISDNPRICLFFAYGYRWLRPDDYREMPEDLLERVSPVRRQLLGATVTQCGYYLPSSADVPLREWLAGDRPPQ